MTNKDYSGLSATLAPAGAEVSAQAQDLRNMAPARRIVTYANRINLFIEPPAFESPLTGKKGLLSKHLQNANKSRTFIGSRMHVFSPRILACFVLPGKAV